MSIREKLILAQKEYTDKENLPNFAPQDGYCCYCHGDTVDERWSTQLITGCNKCHKSFCE